MTAPFQPFTGFQPPGDTLRRPKKAKAPRTPSAPFAPFQGTLAQPAPLSGGVTQQPAPTAVFQPFMANQQATPDPETPAPVTPLPSQPDQGATTPTTPPAQAPTGVVTNPDGTKSYGGYTVGSNGLVSSPYSYKNSGLTSFSWYGLGSQGGTDYQITADDYAAISALDPETAKYFRKDGEGYRYDPNYAADSARNVQRDAGGNILSFDPLADPNAFDPLKSLAQMDGRDQLSSADAEAQLRKELGQNGQNYTDPIDWSALENYRTSRLDDTTGLEGEALKARQEQIRQRHLMNDAYGRYAESGSDPSVLSAEEMQLLGVKPRPITQPPGQKWESYDQNHQPAKDPFAQFQQTTVPNPAAPATAPSQPASPVDANQPGTYESLGFRIDNKGRAYDLKTGNKLSGEEVERRVAGSGRRFIPVIPRPPHMSDANYRRYAAEMVRRMLAQEESNARY